MRAVVASAALALVSPAAGHGTMNTPPSRNAGVNAPKGRTGGCENGACMFFSQGCTIGCKCNEDNSLEGMLVRGCNTTQPATVNKPEWRTFNRGAKPGDDGCSQPAKTQTVPGLLPCVKIAGYYMQLSCLSKEPQYCVYTQSGCVDGTAVYCMKLDGVCRQVTPGVSMSGKCDGLTASVTTYGGTGDWTQYHPWRAPGTAKLLDSCGLAGGSTKDNSAAGGFGNQTVAGKQGFPGSKLPPVLAKTEWRAGATVEVSWGIAANHGGGYQYRLCPKGEALTEECFMKRPLEFVGETQRLRWANGHEVEIPATRVSEGVVPAGAAWTMNPIPACNSSSGGYLGEGCAAPQFPPPAGCNETCWGYQHCSPHDQQPCGTVEIPDLVDAVKVPADLPPGDYVVSWRWDCEHTVQVWSGCGSVTVTA